MALMEIWSSELPPEKAPPTLREEMLTVSQHELTHTLQLRGIRAAAQRLFADATGDVSLDDDLIQRTFETDAAYSTPFAEEVRLLFEAQRTADVAEKKRLAGRALALARARQARSFVGPHAAFAKLDGLFLSMEGLGEWVRHELMTAGAVRGLGVMASDDAIASLRGKKPYWSQDEGLAILLVLEELLPDFRERLLAAELPDALDLLAEAVAR